MLRLLAALFGRENTVSESRPDNLAGRFATARLRGARLLTVDDMPARPRGGAAQGQHDSGLGIIKNLTGGDAIDYEVKYGTRRSFTPHVAVAIASNFAASFARGAEDATAWGRRMWMFAFEQPIADPAIPDYETAVLGPEHGEIFAYCLTAYARFKGALGRTPTAPELCSDAMRGRAAELVLDARGAAGQFVAQRITIPPTRRPCWGPGRRASNSPNPSGPGSATRRSKVSWRNCTP